ncbi:MAG TPA: GNAT family N-acetyltransferase [Bryobacteraceae bacterium]|jgi:GNAT superfamily N-acetyltransferase
MTIRPISPRDLDLICRHRREMFKDAGQSEEILMLLPNRSGSGWRRGYILNLFVESAHRKRGVAQALLDASETEFKQRGLTYEVLHATASGRPLYEKNGWGTTTEMAKRLTKRQITTKKGLVSEARLN